MDGDRGFHIQYVGDYEWMVNDVQINAAANRQKG